MSAAVNTQTHSADPTTGTRAWAPVWRPAVLAVTGLVVAFSAALHEQLGFDRALVAVALIALGATHLIEWFTARGTRQAPVPVLLGAVAIVTGVLQIILSAELAFALLIAAWALISGLLEFLAAVFTGAGRGDHIFLGALGIVLAILVLLVLTDPVAVLGFFGGYALIAGVYGGISFFDTRAKWKQAAEEAEPAVSEAAIPNTN